MEALLETIVLELLASRICHDLISPVGAVNNGVEFMQEMGTDAGEEALNLIAHSAAQAAARLQAFRLAYGAGGRDPSVKPEDVHETFGELIGGDGKIKQDWNPHGNLGFAERPVGYCKMLMAGLMLAQECLPAAARSGSKRQERTKPTSSPRAQMPTHGRKSKKPWRGRYRRTISTRVLCTLMPCRCWRNRMDLRLALPKKATDAWCLNCGRIKR